MKNFYEALKKKYNQANENFKPKTEEEARKMAMEMMMGATTAPTSSFSKVIGNSGRLLRTSKAGVKALKSKPVKIKESGKVVGEISRKLMNR